MNCFTSVSSRNLSRRMMCVESWHKFWKVWLSSMTTTLYILISRWVILCLCKGCHFSIIFFLFGWMNVSILLCWYMYVCMSAWKNFLTKRRTLWATSITVVSEPLFYFGVHVLDISSDCTLRWKYESDGIQICASEQLRRNIGIHILKKNETQVTDRHVCDRIAQMC